jgi:hypothetical protein
LLLFVGCLAEFSFEFDGEEFGWSAKDEVGESSGVGVADPFAGRYLSARVVEVCDAPAG